MSARLQLPRNRKWYLAKAANLDLVMDGDWTYQSVRLTINILFRLSIHKPNLLLNFATCIRLFSIYFELLSCCRMLDTIFRWYILILARAVLAVTGWLEPI